MWKSQPTLQHGTQNVNTHNRTTQKTKRYDQYGLTKKPQIKLEVNSCARAG